MDLGLQQYYKSAVCRCQSFIYRSSNDDLTPDIENHIRHNVSFTTVSPWAQVQNDGRGKCSKAVPPTVNIAGQSTGAPNPLDSITLSHPLSSLSLVCCFGVVNVYTSDVESAPRLPQTFLPSGSPHISVRFRKRAKRATLEKVSEAEDLVVRQQFACFSHRRFPEHGLERPRGLLGEGGAARGPVTQWGSSNVSAASKLWRGGQCLSTP